MNNNNNNYQFNRNFVKKYLPAVLIIDCLFIWVMIIIGVVQIFGNTLLAMLIALLPLGLNCYVHISTYIYLNEKYNVDQN